MYAATPVRDAQSQLNLSVSKETWYVRRQRQGASEYATAPGNRWHATCSSCTEHPRVPRGREYVFTSRRSAMRRLQQGFTLIELMIVVAIVGILAAIALPAYQDYVVRSKMSEGEAAIAACKTSVAEYTSTHGGSLPTTTDLAGCSVTSTQYVNGGATVATGVITVAT